MSWLPDLGSPHHTWIVLDNGEHRCNCGWSPNYYRDTGLTWDEEVSQHVERIKELEAMPPRKMAEVLIAETILNPPPPSRMLLSDIALKLERWGFTRSEKAIDE